MSSGVLRRVAPTLRRHVATKATAKAGQLTHAPLPAHKMRALVSLYHQADSFITPENLSDAIDHAFLDTSNRIAFGGRERLVSELRQEIRERDLLPKVGSGKSTNMDMSRQPEGQWSSLGWDREARLRYALYGVEGEGKPGVEVLEEEFPRIKNENEYRGQS